MVFRCVFSGRFPGGLFYGFCAVFVHLGVPLGGSFLVFFLEIWVLLGNGVPSILIGQYGVFV